MQTGIFFFFFAIDKVRKRDRCQNRMGCVFPTRNRKHSTLFGINNVVKK